MYVNIQQKVDAQHTRLQIDDGVKIAEFQFKAQD